MGIEVTQGFVEQMDRGVAGEEPAQGDSLPCPPESWAGLRLSRSLSPNLWQPVQSWFGSRRRVSAGFKAKGHVFKYGKVGEEGVVLKNHTQVTVLGFAVGDVPVVQKHLTRRRNLQTGKNSQEGGLSATRWAHQGKQFSVLDLQIKPLESLGSVRKGFTKVLKENTRHMHQG